MQGENIQDTIKSLDQAINKDDSAQIYELSSSLVKQFPNDLEYKLCYAISAIKLKKFSELGSGIFSEKPSDKKLQSAYLYYLYTSEQIHKCIQNLSNAKEPSHRLLLAQAEFKAMNYQRSAQIMSELLKSLQKSSNTTQDDKQSYMINILAASRTEDSYYTDLSQHINENSCKELFYNLALCLFQHGKIQQGIQYLSKFEKALEKDDQIDWLTTKLLRDYLSFSGKRAGDEDLSDKQEKYDALLKNIQDPNLKCVVNTNLGFINPHEAESIKMVDEFFQSNYKLSYEQATILKVNKLSMLLRKNRTSEALKLLKQLEGNSNLVQNEEFVRNKFYLLKKTNEDQMEKFIKEITEVNPELGFCLLAEIALEKGDQKRVLQCLQDKRQSSNDSIKNFIFALLIRDQNLFAQYSVYLEELIEKSSEPQILQVLLKLYESKGDKKKQFLILKRILQINPKNSVAKVGLAEQYLLEGKIEEAEHELRGIQQPEQITDLNFLQYIQKNIHISKKDNEKVTQNIDTKKVVQKKRIKKKKKVRLPKNVEKAVEGFKPDPERWLPKWQRKGYKKKGGKKGGKTQGLSTVGGEQKNVFFAGNSTSSKEVTKEQKRRR